MEGKKTILGKILGAIWLTVISLFKSNYENFAKQTWQKVPEDVKGKVTLVVEIVELFKKFVDSAAADVVTAIIPGDTDDDLKVWLRKVLPEILDKYKGITGADQSHLIAVNLTQQLLDVDYSQAVVTVEMGYKNYQAAA